MHNDIFNLNHIFVLFPPGGSGNFISSVLRCIINENLTPINLSASGNAHTFSNTAFDYDAVFSCGMIPNIPFFNTQQEKIEFYKNAIATKYSQITKPIITWTHDYSNIEIYKTLFPNSKCLAITQVTRRERIIQLVLQTLKNRMDPAGFVFLKNDIYKKRWENGVKSWLFKRLWIGTNIREDLIEEILINKLDPKYFDLILFITVMRDLKILNLDLYNDRSDDYSDYSLSSKYDLNHEYSKLEDTRCYKTIVHNILFGIGEHNSHYYSQTEHILAFDTILNNDYKKFIAVIEKLLGKQLDNNETDFVVESLYSYRSKQPNLLITDYKEYFKQLKQSAVQILNSLE